MEPLIGVVYEPEVSQLRETIILADVLFLCYGGISVMKSQLPLESAVTCSKRGYRGNVSAEKPLPVRL